MSHEHKHLRSAGEARLSHAIQIGLFVFFIIVWILDSFIFPLFGIFNLAYLWTIPLYVASAIGMWGFGFVLAYLISIVPGILIIVLALYLMSRSHIVFKVQEPKVVDYGLYSRVRHPMYLGSILMYVGFWVTTLSLFSLIPLVAAILGYNYLASQEETFLIEKFGDHYIQYKNRVPKWLPH
ncbi:MAG: isoprenylcysteine carboxylmethyltransferase family protein [Candidatus Hermodarchaeota archaeon]|nr:isoprenylcysteine carboxylmethyltransferase family protein [Candidatus Hermodarchaeota archaeon]